ncbi:MAG: sigma-54 dependent transcriptional regulator [bacterium]|nr:sigma-54-dependent Fis family transcriptional regulator [Myxococcales bacterium]
MSRILVVEDEPVIRAEIARTLKRAGHHVDAAPDVPAAEALDLQAYDLILTDLRLPGPPGDVLIDHAPGVPVVVMTAYGSVRQAVDAMKRGAADYLQKPFDPDELVVTLDRVLGNTRLARSHALLQTEIDRQWAIDGMVGACAPMRAAFDRIHKAGPTPATVLVLGESGTGKELVARAIHKKSPRHDAAFVAVNCASIPETLIESQLFGHERGAFTGAHARQPGLFEVASGGTLFLDEIGELPPPAQARLLRVLQEGEIRPVGAARPRPVDTRIIAATHRDLAAMVDAGNFRRDLYFRLRVIEITLPPLRDRGDDIDALADMLLQKTLRRLGRPPATFDPDARRALRRHPWPGNVRELENAVERAVILSAGGPITPADLGLGPTTTTAPPLALPALDADDVSLEAYFRAYVLTHQDHQSETEIARRLGISRKSLWERRQRLGLPRPK